MSTRACGRLAAYVAELRGVVGVGADDLRLFAYLIKGRGASVVKGKSIGAEDLRRGEGPTGRGIRR